MNYIRTKDGVLNHDNQNILIDDEETKVFIPDCPSKVFEIIKQADTIGELCDEFVGVLALENEHICHIWYNDEYLGITEWDSYEEYMKKIWEYTKANKSLNEIIYGAIWTDKGLIYVAKMNEKGELELC